MSWQLLHMKAAVTVAALVLLGGVVGAQPLPNIIAYWPADGNANDVVGGNDGTLENGASFGSGNVGQAFDLTGPIDYVRMSDPILFAQGEDFTVNLWVNQSVTAANQGFIVETRKGQFFGFSITTFFDNRILVGGRCNNSSIVGVNSLTMITNGQWHHVAAVFDWGADELRLYIDGCLESTGSLAACNGFTASDKLFVGAISSLTSSFNFNGLVDELQVYERALTDLEIKFIFEQAGEVAACLGEVELSLDIKPGSCPNSFNRNSNGVLPVALVGTESFDVMDIDLSTVQLSRSDGVGGFVDAILPAFEDAATVFDGELCDCHELGGDGVLDLSIKFPSPLVTSELQLDEFSKNDLVPLDVTGVLLDGTAFRGSDCIRIVK